jgi:hypothetical protein
LACFPAVGLFGHAASHITSLTAIEPAKQAPSKLFVLLSMQRAVLMQEQATRKIGQARDETS